MNDTTITIKLKLKNSHQELEELYDQRRELEKRIEGLTQVLRDLEDDLARAETESQLNLDFHPLPEWDQ